MEVALTALLVDDTRLFKQELRNLATVRDTAAAKLDLKVLALQKGIGVNICKRSSPYETRRVVVAHGLGVTKGLEERVGLEDDVLDIVKVRGLGRDGRNVRHDVLCRDRLSGSRLTRDDHALVLAIDKHITIHVVCERVDVRRDLVWRLQLQIK